MIRRQARSTPHAIAIRNKDCFWTYGELVRAVDCLAGRLFRDHRVAAGQRVAVLADRSRWTIVSMLALWRLRAVYVPVDPDYPIARIAHVLHDSGSHLLLKRSDMPLGDHAGALLVLDIDRSSGEPPARLPPTASTISDPAYIVYTSGSTGRPKGVVVAHAALSNIIIDHVDAFDVTESDRVLLFSSPAFDASLFQILMPLVKGASVVLAEDEIVRDPEAFVAYVRAQGVTVLSLPPAYLNRLNRPVLPHVRSINTGGDAPIVPDALHYARTCAVHCTYGPTEATICAARHRVDPEAAYPDGLPLGTAVRKTSLRLLDERLSPVKEGEFGEICIAGPGLALGYHELPDLTRERFITDADGSRLYRSGDLARLRGGELFFVGRRDQQVKIRGYRVEPGEIEHVLESHAAVRQATVITRAGSAGSPELVAYLRGDGDGRTGRLELKRHLLARLPAYMVPSHFVWMTAFPVNAHGKVDLEALPKVRDRPAEIAVHSGMESRVAQIWQSVLGGPPIAPDGDFFALGGDSLKAAAAAARLRLETGIDVRVQDIFLAPTPGTCAELLAGRDRSRAPSISALPPADSYPLSHAQRRLWLLDQIEGASAAYNLASGYRIEGELDIDRLMASLGVVIGRHEALRTAFILEGAQPRQIVRPADDVSIELIDLRGRSDAIAQADRIAAETAENAFDLAAGPPVRLRIVQLSGTCVLLLLSVHHILADGWSLGQVLRELAVLYGCRGSELETTLVPPRIQYRDYVAWEARRLAGPDRADRDFWLAMHASQPAPLDLAVGLPRPLQPRREGGMVSFAVPDSVMVGLDKLCHDHAASRFMLFLAIVKVLLHRYSSQTDIVVGVPVADRPSVELFDQVGMYVNTLALRSRLDPASPFTNFLSGVRQACLDAYCHRSYPFDLLVSELGVERLPGRTPLFDVMVAMQRDADLCLELGDLRVKHLPSRTPGSKFDLSFDFVERDGRMIVQVEYDRSLFTAGWIDRMGGHFIELARAAAADPARRIDALPLLNEEEARAVALDFHRPIIAATGETPLALFDAIVRATPKAVAVRFRDKTLDYADLARLVGKLAAAIGEATTMQESPIIGVLLERSELVPAAVLAAWQSGGAYLPLDPDHPPARTAMILRHSGCAIVLTQRRLAERLGGLPVRLVLVDDVAVDKAAPPALAAPLYRTDMAYCFYTSGSTGTPRGVMIGRDSVVNAVAMWQKDYQLERPIVLQMASFAFDVSMGDICRSILAGGTLVIADDSERLDPAAITALIERDRVDMLEITPVVARLLAAHLASAGPLPRAPALVVVGSDSWTMAEFRALRAVLPPSTRLLSSYGTTEATIDSAFFEPDDSTDGLPDRMRVPIGRPMSNVEALILDANGQPVPVEIVGELYLAGPGVGLGYLRDSAATESRFVPHLHRGGEVMFRTADRAAWSEGGDIVFLGRLDDQLKIRGNRIDRIEIESAIEEHPQVDKSVAVVNRDEAGRERLIAYVTTTPVVEEQALRAFVGRLLPPYAVPDEVVALDKIPVSPNGKVDVKALKALTPPTTRRAARSIAATPTERLLESIWGAALGREDPIDTHESFYALGGDSIRAIGVIVRLKQQGITLSLGDFLRNMTIARLAAHIGGATAGTGLAPPPMHLAVSPPDLPDRDLADDAYPATALQIAMLHWSAGDEGGQGIYHGQFGWLVSHPELSPERLARALRWTCQRHPALRTSFRRDRQGRIHQLVLPAESVPIDIVDIAALDPAAQEGRIGAALTADREAPFALGRTTGPFSRIQIFVRDSETAEIVMTLHHAIDDGWGFGAVERDIIATYERLATGGVLAATPDPSCRQLVALEYEALADDSQRDFWRGQAPPATASTTFAGRIRTGNVSAFATMQRGIDDRIVAEARLRAQAACVSFKAICLSAQLGTLDWLAGGNRIAVGLVTNNRSARLDSPMEAVGLFWNILPLIVPAPLPPLGEIQSQLDRMAPQSAFPLTEILAEWGNPPLDFCFNYVHFHNRPRPPEAEGLAWRTTRTFGNFHFALTCTFSVDPRDGALHLVLNHDTQRFSESIVNEIADRIEAGLVP